jgi:hypothetical protein
MLSLRTSPLALCALLSACGVTEELSPISTGHSSVDAGHGSGGGGGSPPVLDAGPKKRTVEQRNPFGNVAETENLLWDGDFEWNSPFSDQYGWLSGPPYSYAFDNIRVGAMCRSGLKCALLKKKNGIIGIGVASKGNKLSASFWAHLTEGTCDLLKADVTSLFDDSEPDAPVLPVSTTPDAGGWCRYESVIEARAKKPYLFIYNTTPNIVIIDDAVLKQALGTKSLAIQHGPKAPDHAQALAEARAAIAKHRGPQDPPPNQARKALEQWRR